jgi:hypothetical protein
MMDNGVNYMKSFNEYMSEGVEGNKSLNNSLKKTEIKDYLISTVKIHGYYETMVFKKYPGQDEYDYSGVYESRSKEELDARLTHHMAVHLVKTGLIK